MCNEYKCHRCGSVKDLKEFTRDSKKLLRWDRSGPKKVKICKREVYKTCNMCAIKARITVNAYNKNKHKARKTTFDSTESAPKHSFICKLINQPLLRG